MEDTCKNIGTWLHEKGNEENILGGWQIVLIKKIDVEILTCDFI
jgi:hypothetical protein